MSNPRMTESTRKLRQRFLTPIGNGPIRENPLPVRISSTNSAHTADAETMIQTTGVMVREAATGRVRALAHASDTLTATPTPPRISAATEGNRSPSAFGYARIRLPQRCDSPGDVQ